MTAFLLFVRPSPPPPGPTLSSPAQAILARGRAVTFLLAGLLMWVAMLYFPLHIAGPQLDPSWAQSLGHFCKHRFQAGQDYVFTYGPLGYFITPNYDADLFWFKIAWEFLLKLIMAVAVLRLTRHTLPFLPRLIFCGLVALALAHNPDGSYVFFLFLLAVYLARADVFSRRRLLAGTFLLATIGLVKFTLLVQAAVLVAFVSGRLLLQQPRSRALLPPTFFVASLIGWWLVLGQALSNFPRYLSNAFEIAAGYNEAMMYPGEQVNIYLALAIFALLGFALLSRSFFAPGGAQHALLAAAVLLFLFVQWKHGFVRQGLHQVFFFGTTLLCPFLFPALFPHYRWGSGHRLVLLAYAILLSGMGFVRVYVGELATTPRKFLVSRITGILDQAKLVRHLGDLQGQLDRYRGEMASRFRMPQIAARVGDASVDAFNYEQGVVLLNRLNWTPRPVFQSYSAYTPYLQALNAHFVAGPAAPQYLIFQLLGFDGRLPSQEDSQALFQILWRYHPILAEGANLLLERNKAGSGERPVWKPVREQVAQFGEKILVGDLPDTFQMAKIHLIYSWEGLLRRVLYRPPFVYIHLWTADGQMISHRLVPAIAQSGFLLNPFLQETWDVVGLYGKEKGKRVVAFCLTTEEHGCRSFTREFRVTLASAPQVVAEELGEKEQKRLHYPMMPTPPDQVCSSPALPSEMYEGRQVLVLSPGGMLVYQVPAGGRRVRAQYGILPRAYEDHTGGVRFTMEFLPDSGASPTVLWERSLDPCSRPEDQGLQAVDLKVPTSGDGRLVFRTWAGPGKGTNGGGLFWSGIEFQELP